MTYNDDAQVPTKDPLSLMTDRLRLLATRREEMWWDIGLLLDEVATRALAPLLGFDDFAAYANDVLGVSKAEARQLRRVAHHFSRETALRFGAERLDLLLQYLEAAPSVHWAIDVLRVEILLRTGREDIVVPFTEISEEDLRKAVRSAKRRRTTTDPAIPADVAAERDRLADALASDVEDGNVRVKVHHAATGGDEFSLSVIGIDPFNMREVGKALVTEGKALAKASKD
jgi:hypothetical protein